MPLQLSVTNTRDSGRGSLRWAVEKACRQSWTTIFFCLRKGSCIRLQSPVEINRSCTIFLKNNGQGTVTIAKEDVKNHHNFLQITAGADVTIEASKNYNSIGFVDGGGAEEKLHLFGGAISVLHPEAKLRLKHVCFMYNCAAFGGALFSIVPVKMEGCRFSHNSAHFQGGALYLHGGHLTHTHVEQNQILGKIDACGGAGIYGEGNFILDKCLVQENRIAFDQEAKTGGSGGAMVIISGNLVSSNCRFSNNSAYNCAGIEMGQGSIRMLDCEVDRNCSSNAQTGSAGGGGVVIQVGPVFMQNTSISDNKTVGMFAAGILSEIGDVKLQNCRLENNSNRGPGAAVACNFSGKLQLTNCTLSKNEGASLGGALVNFSLSKGIIRLENTLLTCNTLTDDQTIGETIEAFLKEIQNLNARSAAQALLGEKFGIDSPLARQFVQETLPKIEIEALNTQRELSRLNEIFAHIGGGGIATLLGCGIELKHSQVDHNVCVTHRKTTCSLGGGIFSVVGDVKLTEQSVVSMNKVNSKGGGIYIGGRLTQNSDSQVCFNHFIPGPCSCEKEGRDIYVRGIKGE